MFTSVQDDVIDHAALVFGVIQTERTAQIFRNLLRTAGVTALHMQRERGSETQADRQRGVRSQRESMVSRHTREEFETFWRSLKC